MNLDRLKEKFYELYGEGEVSIFFSPSRVNIIGEHLDYNGGLVMPGAIKIGTYGAVRIRDDNLINLASENMDLVVKVDIDDIAYDRNHGWANYPKGVFYSIRQAGYITGGMDILVSGNIPNGAGLSSSASLELLIAEMINYFYNDDSIDRVELAKLSQKAENDFVGVKCGIMDQFIISVGKEGKCIVLDCDTLEFEYVDYNLKDHTLVIMNTNKRRELNDSKYNKRREECEIALEIIRTQINIKNLCQLSANDFKKYSKLLNDPVIHKRAEHVVYENERVKIASEALKNGSIDLLGSLLKESHESLKTLYEVTGIELDTIVDAANSQDGCIGARMTGAGFGGCAIAIVKDELIDLFIEKVSKIYELTIGYKADFYTTEIGDGTKRIS